MASNERIKKYLDAGTVLGQVTRARAEEIVRELANAGDIQRDQAQEWVDNLIERSRKTSEQILELVRHEVSAQLQKIDSASLEALAGQVADLLKRTASAGRTATADVAAQARKVAPNATKKSSTPETPDATGATAAAPSEADVAAAAAAPPEADTTPETPDAAAPPEADTPPHTPGSSS